MFSKQNFLAKSYGVSPWLTMILRYSFGPRLTSTKSKGVFSNEDSFSVNYTVSVTLSYTFEVFFILLGSLFRSKDSDLDCFKEGVKFFTFLSLDLLIVGISFTEAEFRVIPLSICNLTLTCSSQPFLILSMSFWILCCTLEECGDTYFAGLTAGTCGLKVHYSCSFSAAICSVVFFSATYFFVLVMS